MKETFWAHTNRELWFPYFLISLQIIHSMSGRGVPSAVHLTVCPPPEPWWSSTSSRMEAGTERGREKSELRHSCPWNRDVPTSSDMILKGNLTRWVRQKETLQLEQTCSGNSYSSVSIWGLCAWMVLGLDWGEEEVPQLGRGEGPSSYLCTEDLTNEFDKSIQSSRLHPNAPMGHH